MGKLVAAYESYLMNIRNASDNTVASYLRDVRQFTTYLEQTDGPALEACTQETVCAYVRHLTSIGKFARNGLPVCGVAQELLWLLRLHRRGRAVSCA